jgi:hypothetical protein
MIILPLAISRTELKASSVPRGRLKHFGGVQKTVKDPDQEAAKRWTIDFAI